MSELEEIVVPRHLSAEEGSKFLSDEIEKRGIDPSTLRIVDVKDDGATRLAAGEPMTWSFVPT